MECSTAWVVYGSPAAEAENSVATAEHRRAVAEVFAQMVEIEIIALERQLKTSPEGLVYLLHPTTNTAVPIGLIDIARREEKCRNERRPPAVTPAASHFGSISSSYENIDDYNQRQDRNVRSHRRRCLIAATVASLCLLVVTVVVVAVLLLTGNNDNSKVSCGDLEFSCSDGQTCVPLLGRCDGRNDCDDSSDETNCTTTTTVTPPVVQRCILLIGGHISESHDRWVEYYHPTMDHCDYDAIGTLSNLVLDRTFFTSGCYLSDTQQVVIREGSDGDDPVAPPMLYGLCDSLAIQLPYPHPTGYTEWSTAALISSTKCLSCGGFGYDNGLEVMKECYQFDSSSPTNWTSMPPFPSPLGQSASVSMGTDNSYYIIGGRGPASKQVFRYSVDERRWYNETTMAQERYFHSAAALSATEFIVCGGVDIDNHGIDENGTNSCEVYNTTQKKWHSVGNLNTGRFLFAMHNFNGTVYAIGGVGKYPPETLDSVEAYDERTEKWTAAKGLVLTRSAFVSVVV